MFHKQLQGASITKHKKQHDLHENSEATGRQNTLRRIRIGAYALGAGAMLGAASLLMLPSLREPLSVVVPFKTRVTNDAIAAMPEVAQVFARKGTRPDVIIIGQSHPIFSILNITTGMQEVRNSMERLERMCKRLYDMYGVKSLILEGISPPVEHEYRARGAISVANYPATSSQMEFNGFLERLVNARHWELRSGEMADPSEIARQEADLNAVCAELDRAIDPAMEKALAANGKVMGKTFQYDNNKVQKTFKELYSVELAKAKAKLESILTPERVNQLYELEVTYREDGYLMRAKQLISAGKGPVIIVIGASHMKRLSARAHASHDFITVCPMDMAKIVTETTVNDLKQEIFDMIEGTVSFSYHYEIHNDRLKVTHSFSSVSSP